MKRDSALLFQSLLSLALIAFAGLFVVGLLASARLSQQAQEPPEASRDPVVADPAEWKQFYDAVVGSERTADVAQPAEAAPEKRAAGDVAEVPAATRDAVEVPTAVRVPEDQAPGPSVPPTATTALPVAPPPALSELPAKTDAPPVQAAAAPDDRHETEINASVSNEPGRDRVPQETAPAVAASENAPPTLATAPVPPLAATAETSTPTTPLPAVRPVPLPRPRVASPAPPVPSAARVKQAAPQGEREPERTRPSAPARPRVALPRQRSAPQPGGPQRIDPQQFGPPQQSGALSYSPPQDTAMPPGGPQFGPYFPYGSTPPPAQRSRAQQSRPAPYNDPFGWR